MKSCTNCGAFVTADFVRVFGDDRGQIQACPSCQTDAPEGEATRAHGGSVSWGDP